MTTYAPSLAALSAFVLLAAVPLAACGVHANTAAPRPQGSAPVVTAEFSRIELRAPFDVVVREGRPAAISVSGGEQERGHVRARVDGDTLVVEYEGRPHFCLGFCATADDATLTVDLPSLRGVRIDGSGDVRVEGAGDHAELDFVIEGSGDLDYSGTADLVRCKIDGSGDISLRGSGKRLEAFIEGSGDVNASDFPVADGRYDIEGSGDIETEIRGGEMTAHLHGSGDLIYSGEATIAALDVSGSGELRQR